LFNSAKQHETFWKESSGGKRGIVTSFFHSNLGLSFGRTQGRQNPGVSTYLRSPMKKATARLLFVSRQVNMQLGGCVR
jgi:hypothetical protein